MSWLPSSESMLQALFCATWQSALLAAIAFVVIQLAGRWIAPSWRVAISAIPLLRLVVLVLPVTVFSLFPWVERPFVQSPELSLDHPLEAAVALPQVDPPAASSRLVATQPLNVQPTSAFPVIQLIPLMIAIWISGVVLFAARKFWLALVLRRLLRRGEEVRDPSLLAIVDESCRDSKLSRQIRCILTDEELGPATCGFLRPKIVISKSLVRELSLSDLKIVIAHEVEHIRRCDCLFSSLGHLAVILHWFNPLAYVIRRSLQREIELAVDASTLGKLGQSNANAYGELLIRIAGRVNRPLGIVQMASPGTNLRRRVEHLMRWRKPRKRQFILGAVIACLLAVAGLSDGDPRSAIAQDSALRNERGTTETINTGTEGEQNNKDPNTDSGLVETEPKGQSQRASGRVIDANGNPVADAQLVAEIYTPDKTKRRVSGKSNQKGVFSIEYPPILRDYEMYHTWAYARGHSVHVVTMARVFAGDLDDDVKIQLPPYESREFKILAPGGDPCVGAVVRPRYVDVPNGVFAADESTGLSAFLPEDLKSVLERRTDAEGRVKIEGIPLALLGSIEVETPEYGKQHFRRFDELLRLSAVGSINGVFVTDSPEKYVGTKIVVTTEPRTRSGQRVTWASYGEGIADAELDEAGRFQVPIIATGQMEMHFQWDVDSDAQPVVPDHQTVQPAETLKPVIEFRRTIPISGRIIKSDTLEPVVGARISHRNQDQAFPNHVETDDQGRYKTRVAAGPVKRQVFTGVASPYEYPRLDSIEIPTDAKEYEVDEILIKPMHVVKGMLLDDAGDPISEETVVLHTGSYRHFAGRAETKRDGTFEMRVRDWSSYAKASRERWYWAILDQPAINANPPKFTPLTIVDDSPDTLVLRRL